MNNLKLNLKRALSVLLAILFAVSLSVFAHAEPEDDGVLDIAFFGDSFTYVPKIPEQFAALAEGKHAVRTYDCTRGGWLLKNHYELWSEYSPDYLASQTADWDVVVLNETGNVPILELPEEFAYGYSTLSDSVREQYGTFEEFYHAVKSTLDSTEYYALLKQLFGEDKAYYNLAAAPIMKTEAGLTITENGLTRRYEYSNDFSNKRCFMWRDWLRDNLGIERVMLNCTSFDPNNELDPRDFDYKRDHNDYHPNLLYGYCFSLALYCRIYGEDPTEQNNGLLSSADIPGSTPAQKAAYMAMIKNMVKEQLEFAEAWPDVPDYPAPDPGPEAGKIVISNVNATAGGTVTVDVSLENNPGFSSFVATVNYDETRLTLDSVSLADGVGGQLNVSRRIAWVNNSDYTEDGEFLTLTFTVKDDAADGDAFVFLSYDVGDISNYAESDVAFDVVPGIVTVKSHVPGDVNGDNTTNSKDLTRLLKYLAGNPVEVNAAALDINGDGAVNSKDLTRLLKYLAGADVAIF